jgi:photosystem II stability/assembly factor-like uncharacterized protein
MSTLALAAGRVPADAGQAHRAHAPGAGWSAASKDLSRQSVVALAIDPQAPATLYAGTDGAGVFKTADGGQTWSAANKGFRPDHAGPLAIARSSQTVYAGTPKGVFKSTNGGTTWQAANKGLGRKYVYALAIQPQSSQTLYIGTGGAGVFKSTNGGRTWAFG